MQWCVNVALLTIARLKSDVGGNLAADIFAYLPPLKPACRKGFGHLAAIAAEFFRKLFYVFSSLVLNAAAQHE